MTTIETTMEYLEPWGSKTEEPYLHVNVEDSFPRTKFTNRQFSVRFQDARPTKADFTLDSHGLRSVRMNKSTKRQSRQSGNEIRPLSLRNIIQWSKRY